MKELKTPKPTRSKTQRRSQTTVAREDPDGVVTQTGLVATGLILARVAAVGGCAVVGSTLHISIAIGPEASGGARSF